MNNTSDLNRNQYDAFYRTLDPQIGRFWQIDPEVENLENYSPYESMGNNPVNNVDPLGDFRTRFGAWLHKIFNGGGTVDQNEYGEWYVNKYSTSISDDGTPIVTGSRFYGKGRHKYKSAGEQIARENELIASGLFYRTTSLDEANDNNRRLFVGALLPNFFKGGTIILNSKKSRLDNREIIKSRKCFR